MKKLIFFCKSKDKSKNTKTVKILFLIREKKPLEITVIMIKMWLLTVSDIKNITSLQNYKDTNPRHTRYQAQWRALFLSLAPLKDPLLEPPAFSTFP